MKMTKKKTTGVSFDPGILEFLNQVAKENELSRSIVINQIIKEYARNQRGLGVEGNNSERFKWIE